MLKPTRSFSILVLALVALNFTACSGKKEAAPEAASNKGVGPVQSMTVGPMDVTLAAKGQQLFQNKCSACHKLSEKYVGPAIKGVTQRRTPEWIMNMILNPQEMTEKDPVARELLATHFTQMTFQNVTQEEARSILEYFRQNDGAK
ncbi:MAG: cytochrome c [Deltaproteobacteria bacterium]|nr:cytochrome c [Deltaproteobacteria bacterium]